MSSTAIVLRVLAERMQLETPHGREIVGVLLFQDLAVVPLLILIPAIARRGAAISAQHLAVALAKAAAVLVVVLCFSANGSCAAGFTSSRAAARTSCSS